MNLESYVKKGAAEPQEPTAVSDRMKTLLEDIKAYEDLPALLTSAVMKAIKPLNDNLVDIYACLE